MAEKGRFFGVSGLPMTAFEATHLVYFSVYYLLFLPCLAYSKYSELPKCVLEQHFFCRHIAKILQNINKVESITPVVYCRA